MPSLRAIIHLMDFKRGEWKFFMRHLVIFFFFIFYFFFLHFCSSSKSLLANVLDIDDDFRCNHSCPTFLQQPTYYRTVYRYVLKLDKFLFISTIHYICCRIVVICQCCFLLLLLFFFSSALGERLKRILERLLIHVSIINIHKHVLVLPNMN